MKNDRMNELVRKEGEAWSHVVNSLGGPGRVPIRYLINLPQKPTKTTPRSIKQGETLR